VALEPVPKRPLAMQKVVGSNPISRSENPRISGGFSGDGTRSSSIPVTPGQRIAGNAATEAPGSHLVRGVASTVATTQTEEDGYADLRTTGGLDRTGRPGS
jgi:hypothetical protein